jgi:DNA topoisomerase IA
MKMIGLAKFESKLEKITTEKSNNDMMMKEIINQIKLNMITNSDVNEDKKSAEPGKSVVVD